MDRRLFARAGFGLFVAIFASPAKAESSKAHRVAIQIDSEDRRTQMLALGNAHNYAAYYKAKSEPFKIEIVVFGPGYSMVRADMSMMKGELDNLQKELGASLTVAACLNTRRALAESEGMKPDDIPLLPGVTNTPSGVVRVAELQEQGWSYIRP